ncbi:siderophore-interacting protein [Ilumatobacter nonamiensis]|uniref:siderophore-interacting protein n=1 Tax=Ilumatobacter nonamiensis TaxID=467093 RepID=UPI000346768E|nr:siderophore-interacting protein [Ilumatobacter nonamiensis]
MSEQFGTVEGVDWLSPSMVRVTFGGPGLDSFVPTEFTDQYVNALFVPEGASYVAPFDPDAARGLDPELRPRGRRYTIRAWDPERRRVTIDFVAHGDVGFAGRWAQRAKVGDTLQLAGPSGGYRPDPGADAYLFVGDESALPAIAASLEVLRPDIPCTVVALVDSPEHEIELPTGDSMSVSWCHRRGAADSATMLVDVVRALDWPVGAVDVFVHGEAHEVRAVRRFLLAERGVSREESSISPYWRRDHDDEAWRAVKRDWIVAQAADV